MYKTVTAVLNLPIKQIFWSIFFIIFFFIYRKMSQVLSAKYYQDYKNITKTTKTTKIVCERYQSLSKENKKATIWWQKLQKLLKRWKTKVGSIEKIL